ncbi:MAG TPA: hypothetical protein VN226_00455 [Anaerolineales bacterium]|nr:hypothetical protein [Anaerolineales bacterium]
MNQQKNDQSEDDKNSLDDILKALNDLNDNHENSKEYSSNVDADNLKELIGDFLSIDENNNTLTNTNESLEEVSSLHSEEEITFNDLEVDPTQAEFSHNDSVLNVDGVDDLDERLKFMASEGDLTPNQMNDDPTTMFSRKISSSDHSQELNDRLSQNLNKHIQPSDQSISLETNEQTTEKPKTDDSEAESTEGDLEELKQYIRFEEKTEKPKKQSFYKRLNSSDAKKDPLVITVFLALTAILIILISFIASQIVESPAWNPTLAPTSTPLLDDTEPYIIGINYLGQDVAIKPISSSFSSWVPETNESLVIEGSYFCRLVYIKNMVDVFAPENLKLGNIITFNMTGSNNRVFQIIDITDSSFDKFAKYSNTQKECVAIYIETSQLVVLAESTK